MFLYQKEIDVKPIDGHRGLLRYASEIVLNQLSADEIPVRFATTRTDDEGYHCEVGILSNHDGYPIPSKSSIFDFKKRSFENPDRFTAVLLIPTGIGAEIGGHSGDAGAVARLLASACDTLITHPNVVNAADINELPENGLYVEGSVIASLLHGTIGLHKVRSNRVLLVMGRHRDRFFNEAVINSVSAARAALGLDCPIAIEMTEPVEMKSSYSSSGAAVGTIENFERLCEVLERYRTEFDAVALTSVIDVPADTHRDYYRQDIVNPWGGVEAMLTHAVSILLGVPSAHSPMMESQESLDFDVGVVDPRKAAEVVSTTYLHCVLKGLHRSPRIVKDPPLNGTSKLLTVSDISCLVIPDGCVGLPTLAALEQEIPVIAVRENKNRMRNRLENLPFAPGKLHLVDNYLEAVGVMNAIRVGITSESVRRPLHNTRVFTIQQYERPKSVITEVRINSSNSKR